MLTIDPAEVLAFNPDLDSEVVGILIRDGLAMARRVAPCIDDEGFPYADAAVAIIRSAVLRWAESGSGGVASESNTAGPFSFSQTFDNRVTRRSLFFPSELRELEALCATSRRGKAFAFDTLPAHTSKCHGGNAHACRYLVGSLGTPCAQCGETLSDTWGPYA